MREKTKTLQIGKNGVTESMLEEIKTQLKKNKTIKVRILRSAKAGKSSREIAGEVAAHVDALLVDVRGNTFILKKGQIF
ncbi:MAG: YhbY family RNA-binding protein [Candidatus Altiarchaeota archaeon]|nr:YhbY family RNA-binding protein [Candidatus Altiarchaeota archaeon]